MDGEPDAAEVGAGREDEDGNALSQALRRVLVRTGEHSDILESLTGSTSLDQLQDIVDSAGLDITTLVSGLALEVARAEAGLPVRSVRDNATFVISDLRSSEDLRFTQETSKTSWDLSPSVVLEAVKGANKITELLSDLSLANGVPIFQLLGLRNLSAFVGEIFAGELRKHDGARLMSNPHQDGYPDLLALTEEGAQYVEEMGRSGRMSDKGAWSPYPFGGVEVKATCGATPPASKVPKPKIGESRAGLLVGADWKAHHQETNNLIGLFWDFVDELPTVLAAFYRNDLEKADWGTIVKPKEGGGRTTSVSIMKRDGVKKMAKGWIVLPEDPGLLDALAQRRVFDLHQHDLNSVCSSPPPWPN
jgi:hypothetical protein